MSIEQRTIALAGMFQSTELVKQVAYQGLIDQVPFESSIHSILKIDAVSTEAVYGGLEGVQMGLQVLCRQLGSGFGTQHDVELVRYLLGIILLERRLVKDTKMVNEVQAGIRQAIILAEIHGVTHPYIIEHLARLYSATISTFSHRIQVKGEQRYLTNQSNAHKIRALLLAGIRSAVLWRQKGGNRLQFLFSRGKTLKTTKQLLASLKTPQ